MPVKAPSAKDELVSVEIDDSAFVDLDISPNLHGDFIKAFKCIALQAEGMSFSKAAQEVGVPKNAAQIQKWKILFDKASTLFYRSLSQNVVKLASARVAQSWPRIINRMINIALDGEDKNAITAAEFLQEHYVGTITQVYEVGGGTENARVIFNPSVAYIGDFTVNQFASGQHTGDSAHPLEAEFVEPAEEIADSLPYIPSQTTTDQSSIYMQPISDTDTGDPSGDDQDE
jgi:hypothetical protein